MSRILNITVSATDSFLKTAASLLKVCFLSRPASKAHKARPQELVILGNGPSLRILLDHNASFLHGREKMAVNFAANTPEFQQLRPEHYVLADPHFFNGAATNPNVARLWENLAAASWPMTLYLPVRERKNPLVRALASKGVELSFFNLTPAEGAAPLMRMLYSRGLAMPRPRNVLIVALMTALRQGFRKIYLAGADHSWSKTLDVDSENHVVSIQPHFYKDGAEEHRRVATEYAGYRLHDILFSLATAFASYHQIVPWARHLGADIRNISPGSMIDAFPRLQLPAEPSEPQEC